MNSVVISGVISSDPGRKESQSQDGRSIARTWFNVKVEDRFKEKVRVAYIPITVWNPTAIYQKGHKVLIAGKLASYKKSDLSSEYSLSVTANQIEVIGMVQQAPQPQAPKPNDGIDW